MYKMWVDQTIYYAAHMSFFIPYNAEIFLHKPLRSMGFLQFDTIVNDLVCSFCFILLPMSAAIIMCVILSVPGPSLDGPRIERINY